MPKQIKLTLELSDQLIDEDFWILIECLDRPVINRWFANAKKIYEHTAKFEIFNSLSENTGHQPDYINNEYKKILTAIENLKSLGIAWPEEEIGRASCRERV